ncbi:MAG: HAMP domain-containing protein, partial [Deltaproteobacteria bacterium]|nr:HAMP domain-containing protein [Deltaproteobacteria bacterium]
MKLENNILHNRVARKIFLQFIFCAMIPIVTLAVISYFSVSRQLTRQSQKQLHLASKVAVMSILERLLSLKTELQTMAVELSINHSASRNNGKSFIISQTGESFTAIRFIAEPNAAIPPFTGKPILLCLADKRLLPAGIHLLLPLDAANPSRGMIAGELNLKDIWKNDFQLRQNNLVLSIFDAASQRLIFSSMTPPPSYPKRALQATRHTAVIPFECQYKGNTYLACSRPLFLEGSFQGSDWMLVLGETKVSFGQVISSFQSSFPQTILITILAVLFFSLFQIRKRLEPLEKLKIGIQEVGRKHFDHQLSITSGDEFEELANSFNHMSKTLHQQFAILKTKSLIDREILSARDTDKIVSLVIGHLEHLGEGEYIGLAFFNSPQPDMTSSYLARDGRQSKRILRSINISAMDKKLFSKNRLGFFIHTDHCPAYFIPLFEQGIISALITPIIVKEKISGLIYVGYRQQLDQHDDDQELTCQFADQVAIALDNIRMVQDLQQLSWGTLNALANTVDAMSPWTAGHSKRVTRLAVSLAKAMKLPATDIETIQRAGLLHDIGKIGVPPEILDKPGKLTAEEYRLICK